MTQTRLPSWKMDSVPPSGSSQSDDNALSFRYPAQFTRHPGGSKVFGSVSPRSKMSSTTDSGRLSVDASAMYGANSYKCSMQSVHAAFLGLCMLEIMGIDTAGESGSTRHVQANISTLAAGQRSRNVSTDVKTILRDESPEQSSRK